MEPSCGETLRASFDSITPAMRAERIRRAIENLPVGHGLLKLAAERTNGVRRHPEPRVLQRALSDFYVEYRLLVNLVRIEERAVVLSELHAIVQDAFNEHSVQIMSPHFRDQPPGKVFVPKKNWHVAPPATNEPGRARPSLR